MATRIAIVHSSKHGHVLTIAQHLAALAALRRIECTLLDVRSAGDRLDAYDAVIIAGSVHFGRHAARLRRYVARNVRTLAAKPSAFLSVSGSAASLEGAEKAESYIHDFLGATAWHPDMILSAAGAVLYTKYDPFTRLMMKFASGTAGRDADTSRDVVYTNWAAVDDFMQRFADSLERHARASSVEAGFSPPRTAA